MRQAISCFSIALALATAVPAAADETNERTQLETMTSEFWLEQAELVSMQVGTPLLAPVTVDEDRKKPRFKMTGEILSLDYSLGMAESRLRAGKVDLVGSLGYWKFRLGKDPAGRMTGFTGFTLPWEGKGAEMRLGVELKDLDEPRVMLGIGITRLPF
jgi:hypothetical protein